VINRAAFILRYKQPFVDWINAVDPSPTSHLVTLADVNSERTVDLIEVEDEPELTSWLKHHCREIFEEELFGWYTDPNLWPQDRSLKRLKEWCAFELNTVVIDFGACCATIRANRLNKQHDQGRRRICVPLRPMLTGCSSSYWDKGCGYYWDRKLIA